MRIQYKLIAAFGVIAILISFAGYLGSNQLGSVASAYYKQQNEQLPAVSNLADLEGTLPLIQLEPGEYADKPDVEHIEDLAKAEGKMNAALMNYGNIVGQEKVTTMKKDLDELFTLSREIIDLRDSDANREWIDERIIHLDGKVDAFRKTLQLEKYRIAEELRTSGDKLNDDIQFTLQLTVVLGITAVTLAIVVCMFTSTSISRPISRLKQAADQIGKGNFDVETRVSKSSDEIGELCIHFGNMKEAIKNKEKMQNEFIMIASHELRTPIQPIIGFAELGSKGLIKADHALQGILNEARRLQRLVNDILDVSILENSRVTYSMQSLAVNELVAEVASSFSELFNKDVRFVTQLNAPESLTIYADNMRIRQVLNNIIGNALKFTEQGHVRVQTEYLKDRGIVEISVSDTGPGIPSEILPSLFGKFVTTAHKINNKQGSGLGLFITKAIVGAHNGKIEVRNNDGGLGATFKIALPVHTLESESENRANPAQIAAR